MFIRAFSFHNGKPISDLWDLKARTNSTRALEVEPERKPYIQEDFFCYRIGSLDRDMKKGEKVYISISNLRKIYDLSKVVFDD